MHGNKGLKIIIEHPKVVNLTNQWNYYIYIYSYKLVAGFLSNKLYYKPGRIRYLQFFHFLFQFFVLKFSVMQVR